MDLTNRKELKAAAKQRLEGAKDAARIALIYASVIVGASLLINLARMFLNTQISQSGGLSNIGLRSFLSTLETMLPLVLNFLLMALGLGFTGAMLRISRGQYASPQSMKIGFDRFWVLLRAVLLQTGLYCLAGIAAYFLSMQIFFLTPLSRGMIAAMAPIVESSSGDLLALLENPQLLAQLMQSMVPLYVLLGVIFLAVAAPIYYRYVLVNFLMIDRPGMGALALMRESRMRMRKNGMNFFKLDLSLWCYYVAGFAAVLVCYIPNLLSLAGVALPMSPFAASLIFFLLSLGLTFLVTLFLQPHAEITHALAYESLCPRQQPSGGVVLGNIFDLAKDQNPF